MSASDCVLYAGRIVRLGLEEHLLPDGRKANFEIIRHPGGAAVLPILPDGRVVLIRQWRAPVGGTVWEIPAGRLEPGEDPESCVRRELQEEAGYRAGRIEKLGEMFPAVGYCDELIHLFVARDLAPVPSAPEDDEVIEAVPVSLDEARAMVRRGEIPDGKTQLAILLLPD